MQNPPQTPPNWNYQTPPQSVPWSQAPTASAQQYDYLQYQQAAYLQHGWTLTPAYGSFMRRLAAYLIDLVLIVVAFFTFGLLVAIAGGTDAFASLTEATVSADPASLVVNVTVTAIIIGFTAIGGTPGQRMLGLRITNHEGGSPGIALAVIRSWLWIALTLLNLVMVIAARASESGTVSGTPLETTATVIQVVWFFGCFLVLGTQHKQALHDKLAGTYVIRI